jgi:hypothetical protein
MRAAGYSDMSISSYQLYYMKSYPEGLCTYPKNYGRYLFGSHFTIESQYIYVWVGLVFSPAQPLTLLQNKGQICYHLTIFHTFKFC